MISRRPSSLLLACVVTACASMCAAAPERLAVADLVNHPERLPEKVTLNTDFHFDGGVTVKKGAVVSVLEFTGGELVVDPGGDMIFAVTPNDCDLLDAANAVWSTLTPAQRAVDVRTLEKDASLWPEKVTVKIDFDLTTGQAIPAGTEYDLVSVNGNNVQISLADPAATLAATIMQTDLIQRARAIAKVTPEERESRLVKALAGNYVDAAGAPIDPKAYQDTQVFVLYYAASWCPHCKKFTPELVNFINSVQAENPKLSVVMVNQDDDEAKMFDYMKTMSIAFGAVNKTSAKQGAFRGYYSGGMPQLVVTDRYGKILANSFSNGRDAPQAALQQLRRIVTSGAAK